MAFLAPIGEGAAEAASGAEAAGSAAASGGASKSSNALTGAGALGKVLPKPKTEHPYIVGLALTMIGLMGIYGSITGFLPSMLAAMFVPDTLTNSKGEQGAPSLFSLIGNPIGGILGQNTIDGVRLPPGVL